MVKKINFQLKMTNKWFYTFMTLLVIVALAVGIYGELTTVPVGHDVSEIDFRGIVIDSLRTDNVVLGTAQEFKGLYIPVEVRGITYYIALYDVVIQPDAPVTLSATDTSFDTSLHIYLRWVDNSSNEENFEIERSSGVGAFSKIATIPKDNYQYTDFLVSNGVSYNYRVRACNVGGCSGYSNTDSATVDPFFTDPNPPDGGCLTKLCEPLV